MGLTQTKQQVDDSLNFVPKKKQFTKVDKLFKTTLQGNGEDVSPSLNLTETSSDVVLYTPTQPANTDQKKIGKAKTRNHHLFDETYLNSLIVDVNMNEAVSRIGTSYQYFLNPCDMSIMGTKSSNHFETYANMIIQCGHATTNVFNPETIRPPAETTNQDAITPPAEAPPQIAQNENPYEAQSVVAVQCADTRNCRTKSFQRYNQVAHRVLAEVNNKMSSTLRESIGSIDHICSRVRDCLNEIDDNDYAYWKMQVASPFLSALNGDSLPDLIFGKSSDSASTPGENQVQLTELTEEENLLDERDTPSGILAVRQVSGHGNFFAKDSKILDKIDWLSREMGDESLCDLDAPHTEPSDENLIADQINNAADVQFTNAWKINEALKNQLTAQEPWKTRRKERVRLPILTTYDNNNNNMNEELSRVRALQDVHMQLVREYEATDSLLEFQKQMLKPKKPRHHFQPPPPLVGPAQQPATSFAMNGIIAEELFVRERNINKISETSTPKLVAVNKNRVQHKLNSTRRNEVPPGKFNKHRLVCDKLKANRKKKSATTVKKSTTEVKHTALMPKDSSYDWQREKEKLREKYADSLWFSQKKQKKNGKENQVKSDKKLRAPKSEKIYVRTSSNGSCKGKDLQKRCTCQLIVENKQASDSSNTVAQCRHHWMQTKQAQTDNRNGLNCIDILDEITAKDLAPLQAEYPRKDHIHPDYQRRVEDSYLYTLVYGTNNAQFLDLLKLQLPTITCDISNCRLCNAKEAEEPPNVNDILSRMVKTQEERTSPIGEGKMPKRAETPPGREARMPSLVETSPSRVGRTFLRGKTPPSREGRTPPSREGRTPPSREGRTPPSREVRTPPSREGRRPPSREGRRPPSREEKTPPSREGRTPPSREGRTPYRGKTPPSAEGRIWSKGETSSSREGRMFSREEISSSEEDTLSREGRMDETPSTAGRMPKRTKNSLGGKSARSKKQISLREEIITNREIRLPMRGERSSRREENIPSKTETRTNRQVLRQKNERFLKREEIYPIKEEKLQKNENLRKRGSQLATQKIKARSENKSTYKVDRRYVLQKTTTSLNLPSKKSRTVQKKQSKLPPRDEILKKLRPYILDPMQFRIPSFITVMPMTVSYTNPPLFPNNINKNPLYFYTTTAKPQSGDFISEPMKPSASTEPAQKATKPMSMAERKLWSAKYKKTPGQHLVTFLERQNTDKGCNINSFELDEEQSNSDIFVRQPTNQKPKTSNTSVRAVSPRLYAPPNARTKPLNQQSKFTTPRTPKPQTRQMSRCANESKKLLSNISRLKQQKLEHGIQNVIEMIEAKIIDVLSDKNQQTPEAFKAIELEITAILGSINGKELANITQSELESNDSNSTPLETIIEKANSADNSKKLQDTLEDKNPPASTNEVYLKSAPVESSVKVMPLTSTETNLLDSLLLSGILTSDTSSRTTTSLSSTEERCFVTATYSPERNEETFSRQIDETLKQIEQTAIEMENTAFGTRPKQRKTDANQRRSYLITPHNLQDTKHVEPDSPSSLSNCSIDEYIKHIKMRQKSSTQNASAREEPEQEETDNANEFKRPTTDEDLNKNEALRLPDTDDSKLETKNEYEAKLKDSKTNELNTNSETNDYYADKNDDYEAKEAQTNDSQKLHDETIEAQPDINKSMNVDERNNDEKNNDSSAHDNQTEEVADENLETNYEELSKDMSEEFLTPFMHAVKQYRSDRKTSNRNILSFLDSLTSISSDASSFKPDMEISVTCYYQHTVNVAHVMEVLHEFFPVHVYYSISIWEPKTKSKLLKYHKGFYSNRTCRMLLKSKPMQPILENLKQIKQINVKNYLKEKPKIHDDTDLLSLTNDTKEIIARTSYNKSVDLKHTIGEHMHKSILASVYGLLFSFLYFGLSFGYICD